MHLQLAGGMTQLKELWWWQPGYNSVPDKSFGRSEPKKQMKVQACVGCGSALSVYAECLASPCAPLGRHCNQIDHSPLLT